MSVFQHFNFISSFRDLTGWVRIQHAATLFCISCLWLLQPGNHKPSILWEGFITVQLEARSLKSGQSQGYALETHGKAPPCFLSSSACQWSWKSVVWRCGPSSPHDWSPLVSSAQHLCATLCPSVTLSISTPVVLDGKPLLQYDVILIVTSTMELFPNTITFWGRGD